MVDAGVIYGPIIAVLAFIFVILLLKNSIKIVKEKETMVIERFGCFKTLLQPGIHCIIPWVDKPKTYDWKYMVANQRGQLEQKHKQGDRISTQNEVLDLNKQIVISRDNAQLYLDAILCFKVVNAKQMIYSTQNLPSMLCKLLQAQLRNVAATMDVDQLIEDTSSMNMLTGLMDAEANRWGVQINWVKCQKVEGGGELSEDLAKKKNADLQNKEIIIRAKQSKQTSVIESEGKRDSMIKEAEGQAQETLARARGQAQAILNAANAEGRSIKEVGRAVSRITSENPVKYFLSLKYLEAMHRITSQKNTQVQLLPAQTALLQTVRGLGLNTALLPTPVGVPTAPGQPPSLLQNIGLGLRQRGAAPAS
eukprot:GAFH01001971.1.p2 GENE.GAFH01001971.1~~GAFH01001971.1.p2  ORF type:complete len:374 (+),score=139.93 GAFH01001971.1:28-1122(+)